MARGSDCFPVTCSEEQSCSESLQVRICGVHVQGVGEPEHFKMEMLQIWVAVTKLPMVMVWIITYLQNSRQHLILNSDIMSTKFRSLPTV